MNNTVPDYVVKYGERVVDLYKHAKMLNGEKFVNYVKNINPTDQEIQILDELLTLDYISGDKV